jgi:hypothetical protein
LTIEQTLSLSVQPIYVYPKTLLYLHSALLDTNTFRYELSKYLQLFSIFEPFHPETLVTDFLKVQAIAVSSTKHSVATLYEGLSGNTLENIHGFRRPDLGHVKPTFRTVHPLS